MKSEHIFIPVKKKKEKITNLVVTSIKDALIQGTLKPGDKLPSLAEMAKEMNVGISTVREAIKMLETLCVVESRHGDGTFICSDLTEDSINPLTFQLMILPRDTSDLIEFRKMFESAYTFMALENATAEDLEQIRRINEALEIKTKTKSVETQDEMNFHRLILQSTHNKYVIKVGETMLELFLATIHKQPLPTEEYSVMENHTKIYRALRDKNRKLLKEALDESFIGWEIKYLQK